MYLPVRFTLHIIHLNSIVQLLRHFSSAVLHVFPSSLSSEIWTPSLKVRMMWREDVHEADFLCMVLSAYYCRGSINFTPRPNQNQEAVLLVPGSVWHWSFGLQDIVEGIHYSHRPNGETVPPTSLISFLERIFFTYKYFILI